MGKNNVGKKNENMLRIRNMKVFEKEFISDNKNGCVLALGNFDGVHIGHKFLLEKAREYARQYNLDFGVYTFIKHPRLMYGKKHEMLSVLQEKLSFISTLGADFVYLEEFDEVKDFSPSEFVDMICEKFGAECTFCGENFTFGKMALGTEQTLLSLMEEKGKKSVTVQTLKVNGNTVSSTEIRRFLQDGDVEKAAMLLGEPYVFSSEIIQGAKLGRTLGFPTINQKIPTGKILPAYGVYCSVVIIDGKEYMGVTDIGVKPTVSEDERQILAETHIIDFDEDVYGKTVRIALLKRLRGEKKFRSLAELSESINENVQQTREYFKESENRK